jgi:hypothetical protein
MQQFVSVESLQRKIGGGKSADKPGSVVDSHSSATAITDGLMQPTRTRREPRHSALIWPCSGWGLPCRFCYQNRGGLLPHHFTLAGSPHKLRVANVGGFFLLHFPSPYNARPLAGILLYGARTFLQPTACAANQRLSGELPAGIVRGGRN